MFINTIGGMGLTGIITSVTIHLKRIETAYINQKTIKAKPKKMMWNTWSAVGLYAGEMLDPVMITNSKLTKKVFGDEEYILPTSGAKNVMFINKRGCDLKLVVIAFNTSTPLEHWLLKFDLHRIIYFHLHLI
jgi:homospermidine synthase